MDEELEQQLYTSYPKLLSKYTSKGTTLYQEGIDIQNGWCDLVESVLHFLSIEQSRSNVNLKIKRIRKKNGELRIVTNRDNYDERIQGAVFLALYQSRSICEICGKFDSSVKRKDSEQAGPRKIVRCEEHLED